MCSCKSVHRGLVGCGGRRGDGRDLDPINSPVQTTGPNSACLSFQKRFSLPSLLETQLGTKWFEVVARFLFRLLDTKFANAQALGLAC